jgi:hypothetical protein
VKQAIEGEPVHKTFTAPQGAPKRQFGGNLATASENFFNICLSRGTAGKKPKDDRRTEEMTETANDFGETMLRGAGTAPHSCFSPATRSDQRLIARLGGRAERYFSAPHFGHSVAP